jgi:hypothetical protein
MISTMNQRFIVEFDGARLRRALKAISPIDRQSRIDRQARGTGGAAPLPLPPLRDPGSTRA